MPRDDAQTQVAYAGGVPLYERKSWYEGDPAGGWRTLSLEEIGVQAAGRGKQEPADPSKVGVVRLAIGWISQNTHKAPIAVRPIVNGDPAEPDLTAELCQIWNNSRPTKLVRRILDDLWIYGKGNAVIRKVRNESTGKVEKLEAVNIKKLNWEPTKGFWSQNGVELVRENYIWITLGADQDSPNKGTDQWDGFESDLQTLREEPRYTAKVLKRGGAFGYVASKSDSADFMGEDVVKRIAKDADAIVNDLEYGGVIAVGAGVRLEHLGTSPESMALDTLTTRAESRVAANLNMSLMVLGMPDPNKTYSNLDAATQGSFRTAVIGFHDVLAEALAADLLPDTDGGLTNQTHEVVWIYSDLEELREDTDSLHTRTREDVKAGIITPNEGRARIGMEPSTQEGADSLGSISGGSGGIQL